jgi:hypothetical protein
MNNPYFVLSTASRNREGVIMADRVWLELLASTVRILALAAVSFALGMLVERERSDPQPTTCEIVGGWIFCDGEPVTQIIHKDGECEP